MQSQSLTIFLLLNAFQISLLYFLAKLHALYLALDRFVTSDDYEQIFYHIPCSLSLRPFGTGLDTSPCSKGARTPSLAGTVH